MSCLVLSCPVVSCLALSCLVLSRPVWSRLVRSGTLMPSLGRCAASLGRMLGRCAPSADGLDLVLVVSSRVLPCRVLSFLALPCLALSGLVLSCLALSCRVVSCCVVSCRLVSSRLVFSCLLVSSCLVFVSSRLVSSRLFVIIIFCPGPVRGQVPGALPPHRGHSRPPHPPPNAAGGARVPSLNESWVMPCGARTRSGGSKVIRKSGEKES